MAKASKPVALMQKHLTKEEIESRTEAEEKLKGNDDLVYEVPSDLVSEEKIVYQFLIDELRDIGILCNLDIELLKLTANVVVNIKRARIDIRKYGVTIQKVNGDLAKNPALGALKDLESMFARCCRELGLSPSSRASMANLLATQNENEADELLKILAGD